MMSLNFENLIKRFVLAFSPALLFLVFSVSTAQDYTPRGMGENIERPRFSVDLLNFPSDSATTGRFDIYLQIPYHMISFVKTDEIFHASYEVSVDVFDKDEKQVTEKLWTESIETSDYKETISPTAGKISQATILLPPATYDVVVQIRDVETKKISQVKKSIIVRDFSASPVSLSDIMVVNDTQKDGEKTVVTPNIAGVVKSENHGIPLYFVAQSKKVPTPVTLILTVQSKSDTVVERDTVEQTFTKLHQSCFMKIHADSLHAGEYTIMVNAIMTDSANPRIKQIVSSVSRDIQVRVMGLPFTINDLDLAIQELKYIAGKALIDSMKSAPAEIKRTLFLDFWKKRDPVKGAESYAIMQEYYERVDYANKNFSHFMEGWKTDRGNVYIVFGEPSNIERHPMEMDSKPYEIWTYLELNRQFVFIDDTGFGDYRLRDPIWDVWQTRN